MMFNINFTKDQHKIDNILNSLTFKINESNLPDDADEQYGFNKTLNIYRNKIDKIDPNIWKKIRWYINNYDFLVKDPIINRAFYKYWEIINTFDIFQDYTDLDAIFHCAEAPGGFIQGSNIFLQLDNYRRVKVVDKLIIDNDGFTQVTKKKYEKKLYKIYTISLNKDLPQYSNYNLPSYNKRILNPNIYITYGVDNTGDINNLNNIHNIKNLNDNFYLITADGGFDEGTDFNNKEQLHYRLILNEIYSALYLQKPEGHFILKVFDIFTTTSIHLLYLLSLFYENVFVYKPVTSRPTNSEKYIICKNFKCTNDNILNHTLGILKKLSKTLKTQKRTYVSFTLFDTISPDFIKNIMIMNTQLINKQCSFLKKAIELCDDAEFIKNYDTELHSSLEQRKNCFKQWSVKYGLHDFIPY